MWPKLVFGEAVKSSGQAVKSLAISYLLNNSKLHRTTEQQQSISKSSSWIRHKARCTVNRLTHFCTTSIYVVGTNRWRNRSPQMVHIKIKIHKNRIPFLSYRVRCWESSQSRVQLGKSALRAAEQILVLIGIGDHHRWYVERTIRLVMRRRRIFPGQFVNMWLPFGVHSLDISVFAQSSNIITFIIRIIDIADTRMNITVIQSIEQQFLRDRHLVRSSSRLVVLWCVVDVVIWTRNILRSV